MPRPRRGNAWKATDHTRLGDQYVFEHPLDGFRRPVDDPDQSRVDRAGRERPSATAFISRGPEA